MKEMIQKKCALFECSKEFFTYRNNKKYCSYKCAKRIHNARVALDKQSYNINYLNYED